eukprot:gene11321-15185_t
MAAPKDFFDLVKAIGESKSKQEEDRIIADEVVYLKKTVPSQGVPKKKMKELVVRAIYVEMLGQDASFAYIKAVELCASTSIIQKRAGYLAASLCLSPDHEFRFMLVNQIQRDLKSANLLEVCAALSAVCKIVTQDMIPAVIGDVMKLVGHESEVVRKRSVCSMHRLYQMDKKSISDHHDKLRRLLCDKDPCVMGACLPLFQAMVQDDVMQFKDLVPSFVSILKQITEHRLPREYDYHRIPAPWIQMNLLRILGLLGRGDQASSEGMYEVLIDVMRRADSGINVGYAIVYEAVRTVTTIYPNALLLDAAATSISRFIRSDSHNLKYIGIKGLAAIVKDHPRYAADHQMAVIDCLEDPDETLKRKTLDLLFRMTNAVNVEFIVDKLLSFLSTAMDDHFRTDLVGQITQCAERFAPSNSWYVQTIIKVFELAGDKVKVSVAQTLTQLIAEGAEGGDDEDDDGNVENKDDELRTEAVDNFLTLIGKPKLPEILAQSMAWVLGEYGYLSSICSKESIMNKLCDLAQESTDFLTKAHIITALMKLVAQCGSCPNNILTFINKLSQSQSLDVQQRCIEFQSLLINSSTMVDVLPVDASCEDIQVDENLEFLNDFVQQALLSGAKPYTPPQPYDDDDDEGTKKSELKIAPYQLPQMPVSQPSSFLSSATGISGMDNGNMGSSATAFAPQAATINSVTQGNQLINTRGVAQVWGKKVEPVAIPSPTANVTANNMNIPKPESPKQDTLYNTQKPVEVSKPVEPEGPRVLTEKEKMAAALFGGVGGGNKSQTAYNQANKKRASTVTATATVTNPPATIVSPVIHVPPPSAPANNSLINDLLDLDIMTPAPTVNNNHNQMNAMFSNAPQILPTSYANNNPIIPAVHTVSVPQNIPPPVPPVAVNNISDAFSDLLLTDLTGMSNSSVSLPLAPTNDIRPFQINTGEFGKRWGSTAFDVKQSIPCAITSLEQLRSVMPTYLHHVESIVNTSESIFAATVTSNGAILLVHVKLIPMRRGCDIVIKSSSKDICQREVGTIVNAISSFRG